MNPTALSLFTPWGYAERMFGRRRAATPGENRTVAALGWVLIAGLYADGWAHLNVPGLETFFTPWHGALYGAFALLVASQAMMLLRRPSPREQARLPHGYGWGWVGVAVFLLGGLADMAWHLVFGIEAGIDALVSPTHLVLLSGGLLLIVSPLRAQPRSQATWAWPSVLSMAAAAALTGFFLSYVSVFADPGAREALTTIPEGAPGHRAAELPAVAGLGGYLITTVLVVVPLVGLQRRRRMPTGTATVVVAAVALPATVLSNLQFLVPALTAIAGAVVVDLLLHAYPTLPEVALASLLPLLVWAGQVAGLAVTQTLAWPPELWAGIVVLTALLTGVLTRLLRSRPDRAEPDVVARVLNEFPHPTRRSVR